MYIDAVGARLPLCAAATAETALRPSHAHRLQVAGVFSLTIWLGVCMLCRQVPIFCFADGLISLSQMEMYSLMERPFDRPYRALDMQITGTTAQ